MPIVVNTNAAATTAAFNLSKNHANLSKSLARLSSGQANHQSRRRRWRSSRCL